MGKSSDSGEMQSLSHADHGRKRMHKYPPLPSLKSLGLPDPFATGTRLSGNQLPKMGGFRFQLLAHYVASQFEPGIRVADVGGGKGLLTYFLREKGYEAVVIDPHRQALPPKIRDMETKKMIKFGAYTTMPSITKPFEAPMAKDFDLLVGMHAHGANLVVIEGCATFQKPFILIPCCVINEPQSPPQGVNWFTWLSEAAKQKGAKLSYFRLNFSGQNIGFIGRFA